MINIAKINEVTRGFKMEIMEEKWLDIEGYEDKFVELHNKEPWVE